ncbi:Iwr1p KNAG_0A05510 [Huiozyma naganishii CBS 8797]|uniref:Probable RNA polymerase II nuclear localization protein SLC7A6OS n=1 Tax=Huiozyma naganishii (strain ATCC MYA-139 / BCRC 22969 / CBS 8797 / KCTC 17520 / NBRC 10181 / NCYC 3082 / Yp74L-3) TaxID=1071383 RepID=J7S3V8_HUIN7|nr:hypothetical protein KNAG_0A05510 [Kazachstania naganishii CBS 8797]CCK68216.1 hypothetical protein KNAG_0A05510 [Kazachstania naganishii CBS 8797]
MNERPEFLRVKRRRDDDSVQALLLEEESKKKNKRAKYVFKLTKTLNDNIYAGEEELYSPLLKLSNHGDHRHFILEQHLKKGKEILRDNTEQSTVQEQKQFLPNYDTSSQNLPPEIAKMVDSYLQITEEKSKTDGEIKKKPSKKHFHTAVAKLPSLDYVYDVYKLEEIPEDEISSYPIDNIGFVKIVNKNMDLIPDAESDGELLRSDDEDSNDENYYRNDYPEDEDDDRSVLFDYAGEEEAAEEDEEEQEVKAEIEAASITNWDERKGGLNTSQNAETLVQNDPYDALFRKLEGSENILESLSNHHVIDMDASSFDYMYDEQEEIMDDTDENNVSQHGNEEPNSRNEFFPSDIDDPLAQHRDKIFGDLQRMIDEKK